jgi:hypothetical protein
MAKRNTAQKFYKNFKGLFLFHRPIISKFKPHIHMGAESGGFQPASMAIMRLSAGIPMLPIKRRQKIKDF